MVVVVRVNYISVSSIEQNEAPKIEAMKRYNIEKVSAKDTNRPKLKEMLDFVRGSDIV